LKRDIKDKFIKFQELILVPNNNQIKEEEELYLNLIVVCLKANRCQIVSNRIKINSEFFKVDASPSNQFTLQFCSARRSQLESEEPL
jgi:hypothetical protein